MNDFRAPRWLPGGHAQTIWPALFSRRFDGTARRSSGASAGPRPTATSSMSTGRAKTPPRRCSSSSTASKARRRATTRRPSPPRRGGAAGASRCRTFAAARARSTSRRAPTTRATTRKSAGCWRASARCTPGRSSRSASRSAATRLLRYAEEAGASARARVRAVAAVSAPLDLAAGGRAIGRGFGRQVYTRMFLRTMKRKALVKLGQHPGLFDAAARCARRATCATSTRSSPARCTASPAPTTTTRAARPRPQLDRIRIPALVLNARNDPFLPGVGVAAPGRGRARA